MGTGFDSYVETRTASYEEKAINAGGVYSFLQSVNTFTGDDVYAGRIRYSLTKSSYGNQYTKVLSQYAHRHIAWSAPSISISASGPSVSIGFSSAYKTSVQASNNILY